MTKYNRSVTIRFSVDSDEEYSKIANLLWHVMQASGVSDFEAFPDDTVTRAKLNDYWNQLGVGPSW